MILYDPLETEVARRVLLEILDQLEPAPHFGLVGGWAVHSLISENFLRATGREFPKSRDLDVYLDCESDFPSRFARAIEKVGFRPGECRFRYTLIFDRQSMRKLSEREARRKQIFELMYVFLDVLSNRESEILGSWPNEVVARMIERGAVKQVSVEGRKVFVPDEDFLFLLKVDSFLKRETGEKRAKDACDLYGLLFYSPRRFLESLGEEPWKLELASRGIGTLLQEEETLELIAETLFGDALKSGLVRRNLSRQLDLLRRAKKCVSS
ncbi:MAG: hypothetical protein QXH26_01410 [Candidatus Hadarchaeales archaeon]